MLAQQRDREFQNAYGDIDKIFADVVNDRPQRFREAILSYIKLTEDLSLHI